MVFRARVEDDIHTTVKPISLDNQGGFKFQGMIFPMTVQPAFETVFLWMCDHI